MSDLENQLNLLNDYVRTLEKENESKYNEIKTLTIQNDELVRQNDQLRRGMPPPDLRNTRSVHVDHENNRILEYETRISSYESKMTNMSSEITIKTSEIQRLQSKVQELSRGSSQNVQDSELLGRKVTELTNEVTIKRSEIERLQQKVGRLSKLQSENSSLKLEVQNLNARVSTANDSTNQNTRSLELALSSLQQEKSEWTKEKQQLQIKVSNLQTELVEKSNLVAQLRLREDYLKNKESDVYSKDRELENLANTIRTLRQEVEEHKRTITYRDSSIKALESRISTSEGSKSSEISNMQRLVQEKNAEINRLIASHNEKVATLAVEIERQKSLSVSNTQSLNELNSLKEENIFLKKQSQNNSQIINELQFEKQHLKQTIMSLEDELRATKQSNMNAGTSSNPNSRIVTSQPIPNNRAAMENEESELRMMVRQLRSELEEVKQSNRQIHEQNHEMQKCLVEMSQSQLQQSNRYHSPQNVSSSVYMYEQNQMPYMGGESHSRHYSPQQQSQHVPYFKSEMNLEKKRKARNDQHAMSPVRDVPSNGHFNTGTGPSGNKLKWEALQRKISALRVENDELKKTLLYE